MSIKTIIALLVFIGLGVFLYMNKDKVMSFFKGQTQEVPQMQNVQEVEVEEVEVPQG